MYVCIFSLSYIHTPFEPLELWKHWWSITRYDKICRNKTYTTRLMLMQPCHECVLNPISLFSDSSRFWGRSTAPKVLHLPPQPFIRQSLWHYPNPNSHIRAYIKVFLFHHYEFIYLFFEKWVFNSGSYYAAILYDRGGSITWGLYWCPVCIRMCLANHT